MTHTTSTITVTDLFAGAGDSASGVVQAGAEVRLAMNHWLRAIETHNTNYPQTKHVLADISQADPRRYPSTTILIANPERTNHSLATRATTRKAGSLMSNEWYTPAKYIEAARAVLGEIDLDPASCAFANQVVKAKQFYTQEDNGLMHPWNGRIWLNPPYGKTQQGQASNLEYFTRYLVEQYQCGNAIEAILLIPVNTATRWFDALWQYPICFPRSRIRFYNEHGPSDGISFGTCFVYLGAHEKHFIEVFHHFGHIVKAISPLQAMPVAYNLWAESEVFI
ncbi:MAG: DNA N-6-adenine-methyltransferase [Ktedonobacteraceae bacterium]